MFDVRQHSTFNIQHRVPPAGPCAPALPGSRPVSRSVGNKGLSMNRNADFSPQEPGTGQRAWSFRWCPTSPRSCGLKSAFRTRFMAPMRVPSWRSKLPMNIPFERVGTHSTASLTFPEGMGTRWNASLPGSGAQDAHGVREVFSPWRGEEEVADSSGFEVPCPRARVFPVNARRHRNAERRSRTAAVPPRAPSPLNGERAGVRGVTNPSRGIVHARSLHEPAPRHPTCSAERRLW
jgi:hypothetical protein